MRVHRSLVAALLTLALVVAGGAVSAAAPAADEAILPAPPPASYCRVAPAAGWPAIGAAPTPDLSAFQDYRDGLAIPPGAVGAGIKIADVEYEWTAAHEDLVARNLPAAPDTGLSPAYRARDHGTAVLGVLGASDDGRGVTGLASGAALRPVSPFSPAYAPAAAISTAAKGLQPGDILLVELQSLVVLPGGNTLLGPIEYHESVRDAIAKAVAAGIVVIEPAGNGDLDVGTLERPWLSNPSDESASGAIMVGAGGSGATQPDVGDRVRVPGSNYGERVDVQGVGAGVVTTGYSDISGTVGAARSYTACFDGTSSASATVAAAAAVLQAEVVARTGTPLTPAALRAALVSTGLPQAPEGPEGFALRNIGPRPQVSAALASLAAAPQPPPAVTGGGEPDSVVTPPPTTSAPVPAPTGVGTAPSAPAPTSVAVPAAAIPAAAMPAAANRATAHRGAAVRGLWVRYVRRGRRLVITLRSAAPRAVARVGARRVAVRGGRVRLKGVRARRLLLRVSAPAGRGTTYRAVRFRITVARGGAVRITRL